MGTNRLIRAVIALMLLGVAITPVAASAASAAAPTAPRLIEAMKGPEGVRLGWVPIDGAVGYNIHRSGPGDGLEYLATVEGQGIASYLDRDHISYESTYAVSAFDSSDSHSPLSNRVTAAERVLPSATGDSFAEDCGDLGDFMVGCRTSGGSWTPAFTDFAAATGIPAGTDVGARVRFYPTGTDADPLERVVYVVGPYLAAVSEDDDFDSLAAERVAVWDTATALRAAVTPAMADRAASLVYIGFGDHADSQQPTSQRVAATKEAIRSFETIRADAAVGRGRTPSALIGVSLGGVAAKIALVELEREGFDHGVHTYISYDAPHFGAYTPPGLQMVPLFMEGSADWADDDIGWLADLFNQDGLGDAEAAARLVTRHSIGSPVGQELLVFNLAPSPFREDSRSYIVDRYWDLPGDTTRNIAVASGSIDGTSPTLGNDYLTVGTSTSSSSTLRTQLNLDVDAPTVADPAHFSGTLSYKAPIANLFQIRKRVYYRRNRTLSADVTERYERGPCAHQTELVTETGARLEDALQDLWSGASVDIGETRACFIPTFSAVIGISNTESGTPVGATRFDQVIGDSSNDEHLETSPNMDRAIRGALENLFPPVIQPAVTNDWTAITEVDLEPFDPTPVRPTPGPFGPTSDDPDQDDRPPTSPSSDEPDQDDRPPFDPTPVLPEQNPNDPGALYLDQEADQDDGPAAPTNFTVTAYSSSAIGVDWGKVDGATRYVLRRDGEVVYDSNGNGYWDDGLDGGRTYRYSLVAHHGDERSAELTIDRATNG